MIEYKSFYAKIFTQYDLCTQNEEYSWNNSILKTIFWSKNKSTTETGASSSILLYIQYAYNNEVVNQMYLLFFCYICSKYSIIMLVPSADSRKSYFNAYFNTYRCKLIDFKAGDLYLYSINFCQNQICSFTYEVREISIFSAGLS